MSENLAQIDHILDSLFAYGPFWVYCVIFLACFIENLFPPFPGDSFIVAGGGLAAASRLDPFLTFVLVIIGGMSSVMILYFLGRNYGREFFLRKNYRYFSSEDILKVEGKLLKWGTVILIFSRFIVGLRAALAIVAGIGRYRALKMFIYSTVSYLLFTGLVMYVSYKLVENFDKIEYMFRTYNRIVWPVVIAVLLFYVVRKVMAVKRKA